ncbi:MAG: hypothetical protein L3J28_11590 [Candidatus Polarisedimenticolaceae bacterium]|nr:hypothetical protein [Candidatus Polarisedimenticolaceae bacterium]
MSVPENPTLKDRKDFKYIGKGLKSIDAADFASGKPKYGMDIKLDGMKYAAVARCPVTFGTVKSFDKTKAMEIVGVIDEVELVKALNSGKLAFAGIDVFENEPTPSSDLLTHPKISLSPHIGAATVEAQQRIGLELADQIIEILKN